MSASGREPSPSATSGDLTYPAALAAIEARGRFGIRLGLGRVRALLRAMGDPQLAVRGALVGGTNGKGSVIALAASALRAAGYRVGETPKPHLVTYRERIVVDGQPIAADDFARLVAEAIPLADRVARRLGQPTEFELLTAVMFRRFAEAAPDVALVEVGLGGRLDATHAWDGGVAAITNVALDHMDRLGTTVAAIAREKAAIIERGDQAVTGAAGEALAIVRRRCARLGVPAGRRVARARAGLDARRADGGPAAPRAHVRRAAGAPPGRERRDGGRPARRARGGGDRDGHAGGAAGGLRGGAVAGAPGAARGRRARAAAPGRSSSTAPTTRTAPRPSPSRWTTCARTSPAAGAPPEPAHARLGVDGGQGCRGRDRRGRPVLVPRRGDGRLHGRGPAAGDGPGGARGRLAGASPRRPRCSRPPDPDAALDLALDLARGPVVVAGSLYLVGAARARLVDDPALRDPVPA